MSVKEIWGNTVGTGLPKPDLMQTDPKKGDYVKGKDKFLEQVNGTGEPGEDGVSPVATVTQKSDGATITITDKNGTTTATVKNGRDGEDGHDGITPIKGVDYWTPADKAEIEAHIATELAKRAQLRPEPAESGEWLRDNGDHDKIYVTPDGFLWMWTVTDVISGGGYTNLAEPLPDNKTDTTKWVNGYRFSSGGISPQDGTTVSNIIECDNGDVLYIKGVTLRENVDRFEVGRYDNGNYTEVGYTWDYFNRTPAFGTTTLWEVETLSDGTYKVTLGNGSNVDVECLRFAMPTPEDASAVIVTKNEEIIEPTTVKGYGWVNTGIMFVAAHYEDRIVDIENRVEQNSESIGEFEKEVETLCNKIANIGATEIPDYWKDYIAQKIATIKSLHRQYGKDCFSFVQMTDTHYPSNLGKNSPSLARKIMDGADIRYALHSGDWQTRGCHNTKDALLTENVAIETWLAPILGRLLMQQGNHDGSYGLADKDGDGAYSNSDAGGAIKAPKDRETYVHNLTPQELHEFAYRKVGMVGSVHFDDTGTAYYIDDTSNNVRYIGLNTQYNSYELQADGTQKYPKMWIMRFGQDQFDFLINEALTENVSRKTRIVIFAHVPLTQEIGDRDVMIGVLRAFVNRTTYTGNYSGEYGHDAVSVDVDFTNATGTLVGYFHGHTHVDSVHAANGFNIIGTRCDANEENDATLKAEKVKGTTTEQSFDVFTVTPDKIYATKIGAGSDREINY